MYKGRIADYSFELEENSERIQVFKSSGSLDPIAFIYVELPLTEKESVDERNHSTIHPERDRYPKRRKAIAEKS